MGHSLNDQRESGRTLHEAPSNPHGIASGKGRNTPSVDSVKEPLQTSLLNYFSRKEPGKSDIATELPRAQEATAANAPLSAPGIDEDSDIKSRDDNREDHASGGGRNEKSSRKESFPRYPSINFSSLFYSTDDTAPCTSTNAAKLRCILHYFDRVTSQSMRTLEAQPVQCACNYQVWSSNTSFSWMLFSATRNRDLPSSGAEHSHHIAQRRAPQRGCLQLCSSPCGSRQSPRGRLTPGRTSAGLCEQSHWRWSTGQGKPIILFMLKNARLSTRPFVLIYILLLLLFQC